MKAKKSAFLLITLGVLLILQGCVAPSVKLFTDAQDPLRERVLSGKSDQKVLVIPVKGKISDAPDEGMLRSRPSMMQELVSQLDMAAKDPKVRAVVMVVNSPGGSAMASDIIYKELSDFKEKTGAKLVVSMLDLAASGGYYISLPADWIVAHPITVTGSVGVIMARARVTGLMDKLGLSVTAHTSGRNKDMGSPFRAATDEEKALFQDITDDMAARFLGLVKERRKLTPEAAAEVSTARIFTAARARELNLVDEIGYMKDAIAKARELAGLPEDAKVVAYRRTDFPDDNVYNPSTMNASARASLVDLGLPPLAPANLSPGFYYMWLPGAE